MEQEVKVKLNCDFKEAFRAFSICWLRSRFNWECLMLGLFCKAISNDLANVSGSWAKDCVIPKSIDALSVSFNIDNIFRWV